MEFIEFTIGFILGGLTMALNFIRLQKWSEWHSLGITYNNYEWCILQRRTRPGGSIQFRHILIQKYGTLPKEIIEKIENNKNKQNDR